MIEQERLSDSAPVASWVRHEHLARFDFAAGFVNDAVVVDCACGTGIGASYLAAAGARQVHAFDLSADAPLRALPFHGRCLLRRALVAPAVRVVFTRRLHRLFSINLKRQITPR